MIGAVKSTSISSALFSAHSSVKAVVAIMSDAGSFVIAAMSPLFSFIIAVDVVVGVDEPIFPLRRLFNTMRVITNRIELNKINTIVPKNKQM